MTDSNVIEADFTVTDEQTIPEPSFHTVLEVWREVLKPAADEALKPPAPAWGNKMVASYQEVKFAHLRILRDRYFGKIGELLDIVKAEIATDDDALSYDTPEEDAVENAHHYRNILLQWQLQILQWELEWDCEDEFAAVEIAAIAEVHKMFLGQQGLAAFLDNIKFEFTEADQAELSAALEEFRQTYEPGEVAE